MSEDCLTLNVVAPDTRYERPLPVMVFIHGGAYFLGSSATPVYDGASLARKGCVFVSVNYRLGALGAVDLSSLSTDAFRIDDNLYLRDLVMALRWVRDNIASFGGNPDAVTIFGESAGAHAVATLLAVPAAKGLFAQAISESPAGGLASSREQSEEYAARFAAILGARRRDAAAVLLTAPPTDLVATLDHLIMQESRNAPGVYPVGPTYGTDYLPLDPMDSLRLGKAHRVPLVVGNNAEEAKLFTRFLKLLPTNEPKIELLLSTVESADRERITAAYPLIRKPLLVLNWEATSRSHRSYGRSPTRTAHTLRYTCTAMTTLRARCDGPGWGPLMLPNCSQFSTSTERGWVGCSARQATNIRRCALPRMSSRGGAPSPAQACLARVGPATSVPTMR